MSATQRPAADVLGVRVDAVDMSTALHAVTDAVQARRKGYVCLTGVHGVMEARRDPRLRRALNHAYLNLPDGMPTVWVGRLQGHRAMDRVFGPEFMAEVCERSVACGWRHYLYGGPPGRADALAEMLRRRFPGIRIVGTCTPPFRPLLATERARLEKEVARLRPDLFWVGLSTPKQEIFMAEHGARLDATLLLGVGAAFDFHTGRMKDAPHWMKRSGLQWLHRLAQEPRRLCARYARNNPEFLWAVTCQLLSVGRSRLRPGEVSE